MPRPVHFDLTADNHERVIKFYQNVFGWKFEKWDGTMDYWMATTGDEKEPASTAESLNADRTLCLP